MIGYIKGTIVSEDGKVLIISPSDGLGYVVNVVTGFAGVEESTAEFFIYTSVKEDDISLWGFKSRDHLRLFKLLLSVSGVGLRTAQAMMEAVGFDDIIVAIRSEKPTGLKAPGVGKKTAERIILELSGKVADFDVLDGPDAVSSGSTLRNSALVRDAIAAVESLGYLTKDIDSVVAELDLMVYETAQDLVKAILKHI